MNKKDIQARIATIVGDIGILEVQRIKGFDISRELDIAALKDELEELKKRLLEIEGEEPTDPGIDYSI